MIRDMLEGDFHTITQEHHTAVLVTVGHSDQCGALADMLCGHL